MIAVMPETGGPTVSQILGEAIGSLRTLGRRALLALLGIVMGSCSVVALLNIGGNAATQSLAIFRNLGSDILILQLPPLTTGHDGLPLRLDADSLRQDMPAIANLAPVMSYGAPAIFNGQQSNANIIGTIPELFTAAALSVEAGRALSGFDRRETYAVIGASLAQALSQPNAPLKLGDRVRLHAYQFQIVGILKQEAPGLLLPFNANETLFIPLEGMPRLDPNARLSHVVARANSAEQVPLAGEQLVGAVTRRIAGDVQPNLVYAQQVLAGMQQQSQTFTYLLAALGLVSLLGGGVGVMNVMLMNVNERRREIGIRLALGARRRDIRNLFLVEAVALTSVGALFGAALGVAGGWGYAQLSGWAFALEPGALPLGLGSTVLVGLFFGLHPAMTASRLQPVEALRDE
ncbi:ABC transporter permease [Ectopseudomonas toyotomiensis]|uniref:Putative ABC transport system permease protein n=1 Tax=Ectopseudomonas toyotomiensis TaxID=554344 RepID=A0A1I5MWI0_9GAMM|nr:MULTISPECIES: ABC transporter permease [Pseudomonas]SDA54269.1 putative ABC transport system permease protein [Pseudomonas sp. NFPP33]SFP13909.1 putative ABC transport system permease protein [Pseudomonas toyotomiensis]